MAAPRAAPPGGARAAPGRRRRGGAARAMPTPNAGALPLPTSRATGNSTLSLWGRRAIRVGPGLSMTWVRCAWRLHFGFRATEVGPSLPNEKLSQSDPIDSGPTRSRVRGRLALLRTSASIPLESGVDGKCHSYLRRLTRNLCLTGRKWYLAPLCRCPWSIPQHQPVRAGVPRPALSSALPEIRLTSSRKMHVVHTEEHLSVQTPPWTPRNRPRTSPTRVLRLRDRTPTPQSALEPARELSYKWRRCRVSVYNLRERIRSAHRIG